MTKHEQIYALFVEANPYPDIETLPETFEERQSPLHVVEPPAETDQDAYRAAMVPPKRTGAKRYRRSLLAVAAAVLVIVAGMSALAVRNVETSPPSGAGALSHTEQAAEFMSLLTVGNVEGAEALLADPIDAIWFAPIGRVNHTDLVRDYLRFYVATGVETTISQCVGHPVGALTEVTCAARQEAGVFSQLGMELPAFEIIFSVSDSGIHRVFWNPDDTQKFDAAFAQSRFFDFRSTVLRPLNLVQSNGDPVWSKSNGDLMGKLVEDFMADSS